MSGAALAEVAQRRDREQAREAADAGEGGEAGWTVEQLHAQCEQALAWAIGRVKATPGVKIDHAVLVEAVVQERLRVPDRQFRTSRRTLARRFGCSPTRVWNLELRLVRLVQRRLAGEAGISQAADTLVFQGRRSRGKASGEAVVSRAAAGLVCPVGRVVRRRGAPLSERDVLGAGGSLQIRY